MPILILFWRSCGNEFYSLVFILFVVEGYIASVI